MFILACWLYKCENPLVWFFAAIFDWGCIKQVAQIIMGVDF